MRLPLPLPLVWDFHEKYQSETDCNDYLPLLLGVSCLKPFICVKLFDISQFGLKRWWKSKDGDNLPLPLGVLLNLYAQLMGTYQLHVRTFCNKCLLAFKQILSFVWTIFSYKPLNTLAQLLFICCIHHIHIHMSKVNLKSLSWSFCSSSRLQLSSLWPGQVAYLTQIRKSW